MVIPYSLFYRAGRQASFKPKRRCGKRQTHQCQKSASKMMMGIGTPSSHSKMERISDS